MFFDRSLYVTLFFFFFFFFFFFCVSASGYRIQQREEFANRDFFNRLAMGNV